MSNLISHTLTAHELTGACSCGRNQYTIHLTQPSSEVTLVIDTSLTSRQTHQTPLPTFLRVPLHSLASSTHAFFADETHGQIRRVFTPGHAPATKRHFCGFCGTQLSFWREDGQDREVERWIDVNLGTLDEEGVESLEEWGVLAVPDVKENQQSAVIGDAGSPGQPWFEELIRDTGIGRLREIRGGRIGGQGMSSFEWRVVEFDGEMIGGGFSDDDQEVKTRPATPKRKVDEMTL